MSERTDYPAGVPCWVDDLVPDAEAAQRFYGALLQWAFDGPGRMPGDPPGRYFVARLRGREVAGIGSAPDAQAAASWSTYVRVDSADVAAERAAAIGGTVIAEPFEALPAGRAAVLADPAGARFCVWEARERRGARLVNEPGAWAMSSLATPDLERAAAFYGALFGWTTERFEPGGDAVRLFRLPGYVGGEPEQPVSREVVAAMISAGGGAPPRWNVDFWVQDVDTTARRAGELGGQVLAPPVRTPIGRTAVLADPWGASFSVSRVTARS